MRAANLSSACFLTLLLFFIQCGRKAVSFDQEMVLFKAYNANPVYAGTGLNTWDRMIRERGWILKEGDEYHLWYTGYQNDADEKHLGYATSSDGINWKRYSQDPIYKAGWVEDMTVIKTDDRYFMFAEGRGDTAHWLLSTDRVHWIEKGPLLIMTAKGQPLSKGAYGTPAVFLENGIWNLFYERDDRGIWLATSTDLNVWTNVQDDPVLTMGPEAYDRYGLAMDQVVRYNGKYYGYYHATEFKDWHEWTSCVALSEDLVHWTKYAGNPILRENKSSPVLVDDGGQWRLYTMHPAVALHYSSRNHLR